MKSAAGGSSRHPLRQVPLGAVLAVVAVALILVGTDHWRRGSTVMSGAAALAAILRLVLPERSAGLLAVRSRPFDVGFLLVLSALFATLVALG